ncbi:MAG: hypothetical protein U1F87_12500 [Kiritimatiellia bacterium]
MAIIAAEMGVVGGRDRHPVNLVAHRLEHFPVILEGLRVRILRLRLRQRAAVDVADGDDVGQLGGIGDVAVALAPHADRGEIELLGRLVLPDGEAGQHDAPGGDRGGLEEATAILRDHGGVPGWE